MDYWTYHTLATALKPKVKMYVKEYKHRVDILNGTPRAAEDQQQENVGLFRTYDAGASFYNQEPAPVKIQLAFTEEHVKIYDAASAQVAASMAKLRGDKLVKQLVALCVCEIKFLYVCSVPWDKIPGAGQSASADQGSEPASVAASRSPSVLQLPEPAEVGVRFCKPGERQYHCAKHDTEDSDVSTSSRPTVNGQTNTHCRAE